MHAASGNVDSEPTGAVQPSQHVVHKRQRFNAKPSMRALNVNVSTAVDEGGPSAASGLDEGRPSTAFPVDQGGSPTASEVDQGIDLEKAFDNVDLSTLLHKLSFHGFRGHMQKNLTSYLISRKQFDHYNECYCETRNVTHVVLQCSIRKPLSFYYVAMTYPRPMTNTLPILLADDNALVQVANSIDERNNKINTDMCSINSSNKSTLNTNKSNCVLLLNHKVSCNCLSISNKRSPLKFVPQFTIFRVIINFLLSLPALDCLCRVILAVMFIFLCY
jgi:hypothetical protein